MRIFQKIISHLIFRINLILLLKGDTPVPVPKSKLKLRFFSILKLYFRASMSSPPTTISGGARGNGGWEPPPPKREINVGEKRCYFCSLYFQQELFQKSLKIQFSYWIFIKPFQNFTKYPNNSWFRPNGQNWRQRLIKFFEKQAKIFDFLEIA